MHESASRLRWAIDHLRAALREPPSGSPEDLLGMDNGFDWKNYRNRGLPIRKEKFNNRHIFILKILKKSGKRMKTGEIATEYQQMAGEEIGKQPLKKLLAHLSQKARCIDNVEKSSDDGGYALTAKGRCVLEEAGG